MNAINDLQHAFVKHKLGLCGASACIDWALARLHANEDENDAEVAALAGATKDSEIAPLVEAILERHAEGQWVDEHLICGKHISELFRQYNSKSIGIRELEPIISGLYIKLDHPEWLVMLSRNCEYATDVDSFVKPFEDEFRYISELWDTSPSAEEFKRKYDRKVSDSHDAIGR